MSAIHSPLHCHVCGEALTYGGVGYSAYEYSCATCLAAYHVHDGIATYVTPSFVGHGEAPVEVPLAHLSEPDHVRHHALRA